MNSPGLAPKEYLRRLSAGESLQKVSVAGMVDHETDNPEVIKFALGKKCANWIHIPLQLIETIEHLSSVTCKDHSHPYARIHFKDPPKKNSLATVYAELLRSYMTQSRSTNTLARCDQDAHPCCPAHWGPCEEDGFRYWVTADCDIDPSRRLPCRTVPTSTEVSFSVSECVYAWTARYRRTGPAIVVRIRLVPTGGVTDAQIATLQTTWRNGIQNKWNNRFACPAGGPNLKFDVQWVTAGEHHLVTVRPGPARSNMTLWDDNDDGHAASHEFGHMIGMRDEYRDPSCPSRSPVDTGTVMAVNTGPVAQRHITAVCNGVPSEPNQTDIPEDGFSDSQGKRFERIRSEDFETPCKFMLLITGGTPGELIKTIVSIDESNGQLRYTHQDQMTEVNVPLSVGEATKEAIEKLKQIVRQGDLPVNDSVGGPFIPGAVVGTLVVEVGDKRQVIRFPIDDSSSGPFGQISDVAQRSMKAKKYNAVEEMRRILMDESQRIAPLGQ